MRQQVEGWLSGAGREGSGDLLFNGYRILVLQDEEFWSLDSILLNRVVKNGIDVNFMFCVFYLNRKFKRNNDHDETLESGKGGLFFLAVKE